VISDISMPGMGGIGLFKTIQRDGELAKIPWMFTSSPDREYGVLEAGCAYFLGKPFSLGHLKRAVASTLDRSIINR
jgi:CheY-like chemotaxis protein